MLLTDQAKVQAYVSALVEKHANDHSALLSILLAIQTEYGYLSEFAMHCVSELLGISASKVYSVATFYRFLNTKPQGKFIIRLSRDINAMMKGAKLVAQQLEQLLGIQFGETTTDGMFSLQWISCLGMDDQAPAMMINEAVFSNLTPGKVQQIIQECIETTETNRSITSDFAPTVTNTLTYAHHHANAGIKNALGMTPTQVIEEIKHAGLCGRGGAGFPTGFKWQRAADATGDIKYVICNADEGEPGTFKDRVILTNSADLVFEGMTIAAYAIGAQHGIIYLRAEYAYLQPHLQQILQDRYETGLLGKNILGENNFDFDIRIQMGAGAYICGEETALIESLEGNRGEPRNRPPYPVEVGLHNQPTALNNVETLATASVILAQGANWFSGIGTARSKGFKLFSISGDCLRPGLYELPWGASVSELLTLVGGENAKAVQIGGYSGRLVPYTAFSRQLAYEDLGAGSSVIIYSFARDLIEVAENYLEFFVDESCGQCTPCRDGNVVLLNGVRALLKGQCSPRYWDELLNLGKTIQLTSRCGLGQSSPQILLAINEYFHSEIEAHLSAEIVDDNVVIAKHAERNT
ncbi:NAD(P)H-dependent oxidoreductase subunit E [uncultured Tolumonas sp.]|uniref:NAD(P)H-dependent oxidoreductase subunit E n=1 Tax=uncultured Tolumonas sp. TaxID=263765 RepID=UPI002A0A2148|nr:NAD(P)H-dependent oxidoreductase subunit E [uncultured Tolumonas sp.]